VNKTRKALEAARAEAVTLRLAPYFVRQADWLQERFPEAKLRDVEGLVKLVDRGDQGPRLEPDARPLRRRCAGGHVRDRRKRIPTCQGRASIKD
jgi:hypothetical protein